MAVVADDVKAVIAASATRDEGFTLPSGWDTIAANAVRRAFSEIRMKLVNRGYTTAQVNAWDDLDPIWLDLAVYYAMVIGGGTSGGDDKWTRLMKPDLSFLDEAQISIGGTQAVPADEADGLVLQTDLDTTEDTYTKETEL